jgi:hypothetical protein
MSNLNLLQFFDADTESGMEKIRIRDPGSGINIPDPQHWCALSFFISCAFLMVIPFPHFLITLFDGTDPTIWYFSLMSRYRKVPALCMIFCSCFSLTKPQSFADCVGDELPLGWEQVIDYSRGVYYINHVESKCCPWAGSRSLTTPGVSTTSTMLKVSDAPGLGAGH